MEIKNAVIESTSLGRHDRAHLDAYLYLDYGGSGQGFGGYSLFRDGTESNYAGLFITKCLEIADVDEWVELKGRTIRVEIRDGLIYKIGHIVKDTWFCPKEDFKTLN